VKQEDKIFVRFGKSFSIVVIVITIFIAYSNSFNCSFQLDDNHLILNNQDITELSHHLKFKNYLPPGLTRNLTTLTFAINYALGEYDVAGYHFFNFVIHTLNSLLVFGIIFLLLGIQETNREKKLLIALFASLIFALHPVQTISVTYIAQRLASLAVLCYLATLFLFILARVNTYANNNKWLIWFYYVMAILFFLAGLHTKEIIATVPIASILIELLFFRSIIKDSKKILIALSIPLIVFCATYLTYYHGLPTQDYSVDRITYIATELNVLVKYLTIFIWPFNLQVYYNSQIASFSELKTILSAAFLFLLITVGIFFFRKEKIISFSILWFFITQMIESSVIPLQYEIFEYRVYPSMLGYGLFVSYLSFKLVKRNRYTLIPITLYIIILMIGTYNRNKVWKTEESLWLDNSEKAPKNAEVWNALGVSYNKNGKYPEAINAFNKAIELTPKFSKAYVHRGVSFQALRNYGQALNDVDKAIALNSNYAMAYNNKGSILQNMHFNDHAIECFEKAVKIDSNFHGAWNNLSISYQQKGEFEKALEAANKAIPLQNNNGRYLNNRGNIYFAINKLDLAAKDFRTTIKLMPNYANGYNNLGTVYLAFKNYSGAMALFNEAIKRDANYADPYFNRAYIFFINNQFDFALDEIKKCMFIDPNHVNAVNLYKKIHRK
jgi:protein O-mannosyl-transferase